jgi:hypothetical protein
MTSENPPIFSTMLENIEMPSKNIVKEIINIGRHFNVKETLLKRSLWDIDPL